MHKLDDEMFSSVVGEEPVEHLEQRIDDRLAQCIGAFSNFVVGQITRGKGKVTALVGDDGARAFDRPLRKISPALDFHRFRFEIVDHLRFLSRCRSMTMACVGFCVRTWKLSSIGPNRDDERQRETYGNCRHQFDRY